MATNIYYDLDPLLSGHSPSQSNTHPQSFPPPGRQSLPSSRRYPPRQSSPSQSLHLPTMDKQNHHEGMVDFEALASLHKEDAALKARIRRLRLISRIISTVLSLAVLVPITMTVHKFLTTQNIYRPVPQPDGTTKTRTAWAKDTKAWPTYMYFLVAAISALLNFGILVGYFVGGVKKANEAALVATVFSWAVLAGNLVVWCVAAALYRTEKDKNGKSNDLWGWTCSAAAKLIQREFANEVDFNRSCNVQTISWYIGLAQVAAAGLTIVTYIFVFMRMGSKKKLEKKKRYSQMAGQYPTDY
ncbi:hypothetical protein CC80DRAFT_492206 [Byssothecium circinans]|uniref:MARVEL domain-containing protein n=1 Tax=Byssothecium circinans TaxID=147558 RepID=A0A6A5TW78_9PLEO|nr:hypothetical protein CC80DRAFT_492206 [Byssothecium circinans]